MCDTRISNIILVKGGHELENVRLNLFRVTISSIRTVDLPAPFFLSVTELVSRNTATNKICKACIKILRHYCKVWEKIKNKTVWQILTFKKMIDTNASTIVTPSSNRVRLPLFISKIKFISNTAWPIFALPRYERKTLRTFSHSVLNSYRIHLKIFTP
jgi:hypothetical protein